MHIFRARTRTRDAFKEARKLTFRRYKFKNSEVGEGNTKIRNILINKFLILWPNEKKNVGVIKSFACYNRTYLSERRKKGIEEKLNQLFFLNLIFIRGRMLHRTDRRNIILLFYFIRLLHPLSLRVRCASIVHTYRVSRNNS